MSNIWSHLRRNSNIDNCTIMRNFLKDFTRMNEEIKDRF